MLLAASVAVPGASPAVAQTPVGAGVEVDPAVVEQLRADGSADFWVEFDAAADLAGAYGIADWAERGRYVVERLKATASTSQSAVVADLRTRAVKHSAYWVSNRIVVRDGTQAVLDSVTARAEVRKVAATRTVRIPQQEPAAKVEQVDAVEWNIASVNADDVWAEFGVRGAGVVVGSIDTGVQFDHPALVDSYRGARGDETFDHNFAWFDPDSTCVPRGQPCDDEGHGTHVMGSVVGDGGAGNQVGVAPAAKWITAKACRADGCPDHALIAAGQWMLAPTDLAGQNADPARRPQVINNAWSSPDGTDTWYQETVRAWLASGQFAVFANGGNGFNRCATVGAPASYPESYGVGAHNVDNELAWASGLGPSPIDGGIKPNVTAPGIDVRSATVGGGYGYSSGTSMAAAHVSGAVALVLSAAPTLVGDVPATRAALDASAADVGAPDFLGCGSAPGADNSFGAGLLDAFAAVTRVAGAGVATVSGKLTDAATGAPIGGARVLARGGETDEARTAADGTYHLFLVPGGYDLTAEAFGYAAETAAVTAVAGQVTRHDAALDPVPRVRLSGVVTDGSGHGWPLRASVDISGYPGGPVSTDAVTGAYSVELVPGGTHTVTVAADGYQPSTREVTVPAGDSTQDFTLLADATCTAPGYRLQHGLFEAFDSGSRPDGWTVVINEEDFFDPTARAWRFNNPFGRGNLTGGTGLFATADSDFEGFVAMDTELVSPPVDLSAVDAPVIRFRQDFSANSHEIAEVDLSIDGGSTWETVFSQPGDFGLGDRRGPRVEEIPVPGAAGLTDVRVRFHYYNAMFDWWWQVDDVLVGGGPCARVDGGLVVGKVTDAATGVALPATVTSVDDPPETTTAGRDGRYALFTARTGERTFTASHNGFESHTRAVDVVAGAVTRADFALGSGHLVVSPPKVESTVEANGSSRTTLTLTNDGTVDARFTLSERDRGFASATTPNAGSTPVQRVRVPGHNGWAGPAPGSGDGSDPAATEPPWEAIAGYPGRVYDTASATHDGKVYVVGGIHGADGDSIFSNDLYVYDPADNRWNAKADFTIGREAPAAAFIGDKLYVAGGWDDVGKSVRRLEIYDPTTDTWTLGADAPEGRTAPGLAALDGKLYLIAGCVDATCSSRSEVFRYDPAANSWQTLGDYPEAVSFLSCGTIDGRLHCAGGSGDTPVPTTGTYSYDPTTDTWTPVAPMTVPRWGGAHAVANGQLIVAGGVAGAEPFGGGWFYEITNEVTAYDPVTDTWTALPAMGNAVYRTSGACGFYKIGGIVDVFPSPKTRLAERLPGYDQCGSSDVPWMELSTTTGTVPAGGSVTVDVTLTGSEQPGTLTGVVTVTEDTPHQVPAVPVSVSVTPPASWGKVQGTVTGLGHCDTAGAPAVGATVDVDGAQRDFRLTTGADGTFAVWMDSANGPVSVTATRDGFVAAAAPGVAVTAGKTTKADLALRPDQGCAVAEPARLDLTVGEGRTVAADLVLRNRGAGGYDAAVAETPFLLDPTVSRPIQVRASDSAGLPGTPPEPVAPIPSWFDGARVPGGISSYAHAQCDGDPDRLYLFSGINAGGVSADATWRYDAAANSWAELAPLPQDLWPESRERFGLTNAAAVCEAGQIHLIGGTHNFVYRDVHFVYDIARDTWTTAAPAPRVVAEAAAAAWNGRVYLVGGADDQVHGTTDEVDVYDIATDTWTTSPTPMPVAAEGMAYARAGKYLYLAGGTAEVGSPAPTTTQRLDLVTGEWTTGPALPAGRFATGLAATDTALYLLGGFQLGRGATDNVERLALADWPGGSWTSFDPLPENKLAHAGFCSQAITGAEIVTAGGFDTGSVSERTLVHGISPERCPTIRADVPWLSVSPAAAAVPADDSATLRVTVDAANLAVGEHQATLLVRTTDPGAPELRVPIRVAVQALAPPSLYLSVESGGAIGAADEDIVGVNPDGVVTPYFDGSDVGLAGLAVDAFARLPDGALALSFTEPGTVPGVGAVDDSDLVRFVPTALGKDTEGTFGLWFDGSDVAMTTDDEDIDAVDVLADGRIALSTVGDLKVTGMTAADEDLTAFTPTTLGPTTAGSYAVLFDGSDVGLSTADEDVDAAAFRTDGVLVLSTIGALAAPGVTASDDDLVAFTPTLLGRDTTGRFAALFDGAALGLEPDDVTGVEVP
ncbi:Serine protease, subtilisin family [Actinokineospora alba]|uniref:Serine protease, subtilisin family n=1 Tax=Actinokineospora alba TaxID=504798 RepID=A0A1H0F1F3_9PSEU|nr:subtilisin family serine protease [Actinokineospora alba]SDI19832.1 Serine protease, subtilisin family [Actinokineospora alba]SDN88369.1 Serine protease, subtilisin family [Actinokineospora alba]